MHLDTFDNPTQSEEFSIDHMVYLIKEKIRDHFQSIEQSDLKKIIKLALLNANVVVTERKIFEIQYAILSANIEKVSVKHFKPMAIAVETGHDIDSVMAITLAIGKILNLNRLPDPEDLSAFYKKFPVVQKATMILTDGLQCGIETNTLETIICTFFYKYFNNGGNQKGKCRDDVNTVVGICDGISEINAMGGQFPVSSEYVEEILGAWEVPDDRINEYRIALNVLLQELANNDAYTKPLAKVVEQRNRFIDKGEVETKAEWDLIQDIIDDELDKTGLLLNLNERKELDHTMDEAFPRFLISNQAGDYKIVVANKQACDFFLDDGVFLDYSSNSLLDVKISEIFSETNPVLGQNEEEVLFALDVLKDLFHFIGQVDHINVDSFAQEVWNHYERMNGFKLTPERYTDLRTFVIDGQELSLWFEYHEISKRQYIDISFHPEH